MVRKVHNAPQHYRSCPLLICPHLAERARCVEKILEPDPEQIQLRKGCHIRRSDLKLSLNIRSPPVGKSTANYKS